MLVGLCVVCVVDYVWLRVLRKGWLVLVGGICVGVLTWALLAVSSRLKVLLLLAFVIDLSRYGKVIGLVVRVVSRLGWMLRMCCSSVTW